MFYVLFCFCTIKAFEPSRDLNQIPRLRYGGNKVDRPMG